MHISVMLEKCLESLNLKSDSTVVDCTLGYGGHSSEILKRIPKGKLYSFDQDEEAIMNAKKKLEIVGNNFEIIKSNFINIKEELAKKNINKVDAILYDLGVSSPQLDEDYRGFSFHTDSKLDMRMDQNQKLSAYEVVNNYDLEEIIKILRKYGEEKFAVSIAKGIVKNRPIETTLQLAEVIKNNVPMSYRKEKHPARKTFQAIRIEVNDELNVFEKSLKDALELIDVNGRIAVLTFHSLEDKICKYIFKEISSIPDVFKNMPIIPLEYQPNYKIIGSYKPNKVEIEQNRRARSATLRVIERVK